MPHIHYEDINIQRLGLALIEQINAIIAEYEKAGYALTLRQAYYQLVSRDLIPNTENSYKNIGNLINSGRLAGLIDWNAIEDRTRYSRARPHWTSPSEIIESAASQYHRDLWEGQSRYVETWVEKDALIGIVEQAAKRLDCPSFSCRDTLRNRLCGPPRCGSLKRRSKAANAPLFTWAITIQAA